jgi:2-polyprenyl-3-methyl-5-hydroxy-6-metoxy-1,4-benzoquinol methylase
VSHHHDQDRHDAVVELSQMYTAEFWDERYGSTDQVWSGNPNLRLVEQATPLTPGAALDVGCGEGADAIWLAGRGWRVTGVDVSTVALQRASAHAAAAGVADRITWEPVDALTWAPAAASYDLVSAQYIHLPPPELADLLARLGAAVRPGGMLLVVGHHPLDLQTTMRAHRFPELLLAPEQIAASLDRAEWTVTTAEPERPATDLDGVTAIAHDAVVVAVRR